MKFYYINVNDKYWDEVMKELKSIPIYYCYRCYNKSTCVGFYIDSKPSEL